MYNVGDIIYIYKENNDTIFPCVVSEEICKKNLNGETKSYTILLPDAEGTTIELSRLEVKVFSSLDEFQKYYIQNYKDRISQMMKSCEDIKNQKFRNFLKTNNEKLSQDLIVKEEKVDNSSKEIIINEDNVKLKIDMSKLTEMGI